MEAGIGFPVDRLHARGIIDMRDCRNLGSGDIEFFDAEQRLLGLGHGAPALRPDARHQQHIGTVPVELEPVLKVLAQD